MHDVAAAAALTGIPAYACVMRGVSQSELFEAKSCLWAGVGLVWKIVAFWGAIMNTTCRISAFFKVSLVAAAWAFGMQTAFAEEVKVALSGDQEVPAVTTSAKGEAVITIGADKSVTGRVTTTGIDGIAAHIHLAAPGKNGPPVVALEKKGDNVWSTPEGAKLTDEQYASFKAGELYVNVHSAAHKGGEIRGQLKP